MIELARFMVSQVDWQITSRFAIDGLTSIFFPGPRWQDNPTSVYAYVGVPDGTPPDDGWPGIVLAHGGRGTAFGEWVKLWTSRGYAAIAMDLEGHLPDLARHWPNRLRNPDGGPSYPGPLAKFGDIPLEDQWPYHASANVILAHSILRQWPAVDSRRIGLMGISWGGILSLLSAAIDHRFCAIATVYGCGYIAESDGTLRADFVGDTPAATNLVTRWDPAAQLSRIKMPSLWVNSTVDPFFPLDVFSKSAAQVTGPAFLKIDPTLSHGHAPAWSVPEVFLFMNQELRRDTPVLRKFETLIVDQEGATFEFLGEPRPVSARVLYTEDRGQWAKRVWKSKELELGLAATHCRVFKPTAKTTACFLTCGLEGGCHSSSKLVQFST